MTIYKVRHKPSGLFFSGKGDWNCLVPDGKWYKTKNTYLRYLEQGFKPTLTVDMDSKLYKQNETIFRKLYREGYATIDRDWHDMRIKVTADDFELVAYDVELTNPRVVK